MSAEEYLRSILSREVVDNSILCSARSKIEPLLQSWANGRLMSLKPSGSFAKGTANKSGTDIDFLVSISPDCSNSLSEIYNSLYNHLVKAGLQPKKQNVSINIKIDGYSVDLVPAKQQNFSSSDHSLYRRKADTWTKTNIDTHILYVRGKFRSEEIRIIKLWRNQKGLDFPSFYLEMAVIEALHNHYSGGYNGELEKNILRIFQYLHTDFTSAGFVDPANMNNIISDDLTEAEKKSIQSAAGRALSAKNWNEIVR